MSKENVNSNLKNTQKPMGGRRGGPMGGFGMPVEKAKNFKGTFIRLLRYLRPHKVNLIVVLVFAILSTTFTVYSPQKVREAMNKLQDGYSAHVTLEKLTNGQNNGQKEIEKIIKNPQKAMADLQRDLEKIKYKNKDSGSSQKTTGMENDQSKIKEAFGKFGGIAKLSETKDSNKRAEICEQLFKLGEESPIIFVLMFKDSLLNDSDSSKNSSEIKLTEEQKAGVINAIRETNGEIDFSYIGWIAALLIAMYLISSGFS
ncbi:MAG: hypothetical protein Q8942_03500, partial [Bacillota bacterium]|nr:hypothetical protein [Bacillota bacterium]